MDTLVEASPENGVVQTLVLDGERAEIVSVSEHAPLSVLCKKPRPDQG